MDIIKSFIDLPKLLKKEKTRFDKKGLKDIACSYSFLLITENSYPNEESENVIYQNIKKSPLITFDQSEKLNEMANKKYLIIGLEKTLIIFEKFSLSESFLNKFLHDNVNIPVCFLSSSKCFFDKPDEIKNTEIPIDNFFLDEIQNFCESFKINKKNIIFNFITPCISSYLIKKSYILKNKYRIEQFIDNRDLTEEIIQKNEYIELRNVGSGSSFTCFLIYLIKKGLLCVIKKPYQRDDISKLSEREKRNYHTISHPFLPAFYGIIEDEKFTVVEFINGKTLNKIEKIKLEFKDILNIIFELMLIFKYFYDNQMVYRDLKPDNIMIDENKELVLIDFDNLVEIDECKTGENTLDIGYDFIAPEIKETKKFSYQSDVYSLGKIIEFIMEKIVVDAPQNEHSAVNEIISKCIDLNAKNRPSISDIIHYFISKIHGIFKLERLHYEYGVHFRYYEKIIVAIKNYKINKNDPNEQSNLGRIYYEGIYVEQDINKSIHYLSLAAKQNDPNAQFKLGIIYEEGKYIKQDINKAIYYYSLAAKQNNPKAQFKFGVLYIKGKYVKQDINMSIHYLSLAADQNHTKAQFKLGNIYEEGKYIKQDINKAIYYYSLAAEKNHPMAVYYLGLIYEEGKYVVKNINKAICYYLQAANLNNPKAQLKLGYFYYSGKYFNHDIIKAIHYYSLAADQNFTDAYVFLGGVYYAGKYIEPDISKAIHYFSFAANKNDLNAQYFLGLIYFDDTNASHDINKAIHYLTLAADQNQLNAQFELAKIYFEGKYIKHDINKAIHYLTLAADQNHLIAQFELAKIYFEGKYIKHDINKSIHYFTLAANQKHIYAQFRLGSIYSEGEYIDRDINKAIHYFTLAADQNDRYAQHNLGIIYSQGIYVKCNIQKAIHYYSLAANQNDPHSQHNLGLIYENGLYINRDIDKAIYYYSLAANQNHPCSLNNLGLIYSYYPYNKPDIDKSVQYLQHAANLNNPHAQYNLGLFYYDGLYTKPDIIKSIRFFTQAANQFYPKAQFYLGLIYYFGKYISRDISKAIYYFTLSANQNDPNSQYILGVIYYEGKYIQQNLKKGRDYIILSSMNELRFANFAHGFLYHEGKSLKKDIKEAIRYYKEASSFNIHYAKNNIGIIYKHGYDDIEKNINFAIIYFEEAIRQKNDYLSMYNLAHIYIYDETINESINKSIDLLIKSAARFHHSFSLLCLALIKQFDFDVNAIIKNIEKYQIEDNDFKLEIIKKIKEIVSLGNFESFYETYRKRDFLYNFSIQPVLLSDIDKMNINDIKEKNPNKKPITQEFYEGFGIF